eukprot:gb/GFBE01029404.1/.p1 GENE.gb/GFBE01029404.1/~~gb/GFBE01029404.1/.p1  ORF type:complete len:155 (+),score=39.12 gb/GFBE01029404.1/:1-465(+)
MTAMATSRFILVVLCALYVGTDLLVQSERPEQTSAMQQGLTPDEEEHSEDARQSHDGEEFKGKAHCARVCNEHCWCEEMRHFSDEKAGIFKCTCDRIASKKNDNIARIMRWEELQKKHAKPQTPHWTVAALEKLETKHTGVKHEQVGHEGHEDQ